MPKGVTPAMLYELVSIYNGAQRTTICKQVADIARSFGVKTKPQGIGWKFE